MEGFDPELFVPTDFTVETFTFGTVEQRLLCLKAATTDYDLTGLIVWPASRVLSWLLVQKPELVDGKHVVEVGAGCGLTGLVAGKCGAASVTLTDGNARVLDLLRRNCTLNNLAGDVAKVAPLTWGEAPSALQELLGRDGHWPRVFLGADVFQTSFGSPSLLFRTVKILFLAAQDHGVQAECAFYACFALRATTKEDLIAECAAQEGFQMDKLCIRDILPQGVHPDDFTKEKLRLIKYTLTS